MPNKNEKKAKAMIALGRKSLTHSGFKITNKLIYDMRYATASVLQSVNQSE